MNIYEQKSLMQKVVNMSSRQQVLFLLQQTMKEADWDMENQLNDDNKDLQDLVIKNENDEFDGIRKRQVSAFDFVTLL